MTITFQIEYLLNDDFDYIEVELEAFPTWDDGAYDDEYGTVRHTLAPTMEYTEVLWNKKLYSQFENDIIFSYIRDHYDEVEEKFINEFLNQ